MNAYELERLAAQRQADYLREAERDAAGLRPGRVGVAVASALRVVADWLDGGAEEARRTRTVRALD